MSEGWPCQGRFLKSWGFGESQVTICFQCTDPEMEAVYREGESDRPGEFGVHGTFGWGMVVERARGWEGVGGQREVLKQCCML